MEQSERPVNLYRKRGDREVWERAQRDADAADRSLSRQVVAALREQQERADRAAQRPDAQDAWDRRPPRRDGDLRRLDSGQLQEWGEGRWHDVTDSSEALR